MGGAKPKQACDWLAERVAPDLRQVEYYTSAFYARHLLLFFNDEERWKLNTEVLWKGPKPTTFVL